MMHSNRGVLHERGGVVCSERARALSSRCWRLSGRLLDMRANDKWSKEPSVEGPRSQVLARLSLAAFLLLSVCRSRCRAISAVTPSVQRGQLQAALGLQPSPSL